MDRSGYTSLSESSTTSLSRLVVTGFLAVVGAGLCTLIASHSQELFASPSAVTRSAAGLNVPTGGPSRPQRRAAVPGYLAAAEREPQSGLQHPRDSPSQISGVLANALGVGCALTGLLLLAGRWAQPRAKVSPLGHGQFMMAAAAGDDSGDEEEFEERVMERVERPAQPIPGIKARPAGYRHDVTRGYQLEEVMRPRRNRRHPALRALMRETHLSPANFIMPLFIHDVDEDTPIGAMPGCSRLCAASVLREVGECVDMGIHMFILFPKVSDDLKTPDGRQCYDPTDIVMRTVKLIKGAYPDAVVCTDIALDPYNTDGHDGIVDEYTGVILNDITVEQLCKQAVAQARAGTDIVAPSDMQDGRIGAIRDALDSEGFTHVGIMSYCAKYASAFYGPFREALDSNPSFGDKATYQMDPANRREALREIELDEAEGADILMVKPAMPYLDIILTLKENSALPIAAYQVSGEYSMIKAGGAAGFIDEQKVALESLLSIRRAGADVIVTYFAKDAARWMADPDGWWQKKMTGRL